VVVLLVVLTFVVFLFVDWCLEMNRSRVATFSEVGRAAVSARTAAQIRSSSLG